MCCNTAFKVFVLVVLCHGSCRANDRKNEIPVSVPESMCEPCVGQDSNLAVVYDGGCPKPIDIVGNVSNDMMSTLKTTRNMVLRELYKLKKIYQIPDNFTNLVLIDGLGDIENSKFAKLLPKDNQRNKPKRLLYLIYIRTLLFSAYTDALSRIYTVKKHSLPNNIDSTTRKLRTISCTTSAIAGQLGIQIKQKMTKKLCNFRNKIDPIRSTDYETSILMHGQKLIEESERDLQDFVKILNGCELKKCNSVSKLRLKCKREKRFRMLGEENMIKANKRRKGRKGKKGKKGKKDKKCGKGEIKRKNRKGRVRCIKRDKKLGRKGNRKDRKKTIAQNNTIA